MPAFNPDSFLDALAAWMAGRAGVEYAGTPRALWRHKADESQVAKDSQGRPGVYSVLRMYPGSELRPVALWPVAVQCETVGHGDAAVWARVNALFQALLDGNGGPVRNVALPGFKLLGVTNLRPPGQIARDDQGRPTIVFNFDAKAVATA